MGLDIFFELHKIYSLKHFRKVNFLVGYFEELGLDVENQTPLSINKEDVEELIRRCEEVLKDHSVAEDLLPTTPGFFFGSLEYNEDYFKDVQDVLEYLKNNLLPKFDSLEPEDSIYFSIWY